MRCLGEGSVIYRKERLAVNTAYPRLLLMCGAFAFGETLAWTAGAFDMAMWVGLAFGAAAYILTQDVGRGGGGRGQPRYYRGRRIDDDKRRWN